MSKKISFILLSSILCSSTINGMEKFVNPVLAFAGAQTNEHPYATTATGFFTGLVATDALRKFPVGSALVNGTRAAFSAAGTKLATAGTKTKDGVVVAYDVVRHPVNPTKNAAKAVKDAVIAHPYKTGFTGTGVVVGAVLAEEEIRRGFPISASVKDTTVTYAPKAWEYVKGKSSLALDSTKEIAPKVWAFTRTIPSTLLDNPVKTGLGTAGITAVSTALYYRSAIKTGITTGSKATWSRTISAWNWLKNKVTKTQTDESQNEASSEDQSK